jgi:hypothetical protein
VRLGQAGPRHGRRVCHNVLDHVRPAGGAADDQRDVAFDRVNRQVAGGQLGGGLRLVAGDVGRLGGGGGDTGGGGGSTQEEGEGGGGVDIQGCEGVWGGAGGPCSSPGCPVCVLLCAHMQRACSHSGVAPACVMITITPMLGSMS